jgi:uncharacterized protein (UPF0305 family)
MKIIVSTLCGERLITAKDKNAKLFQIKQVLNQHRDLVINRFLKDIPYYLAVRYKAFATESDLEEIKSKLDDLRKKDIDLVNYSPIVEEIKERSKVKLNNALFFQEIDELLLGKRQVTTTDY